MNWCIQHAKDYNRKGQSAYIERVDKFSSRLWLYEFSIHTQQSFTFSHRQSIPDDPLLYRFFLSQVEINNFAEAMESLMNPYIPMVVKTRMVQRKRVAVLISGTGTNLKSLLEATSNRSDIMRAEIVLVVSNKHNVEGLNIARNAGIPTKVSTYKHTLILSNSLSHNMNLFHGV